MATGAARSGGVRPAGPARASARSGRRGQVSGGNEPGPTGQTRRQLPGDAGSAPFPLSRASAPVHLSDLYRGWPQLGLVRDLAFGEFSHQELASSLGCAAADIREFAEQHSEEIAETRAALAGQLAIETAGLWIAKRQNRLAEYQSDAEDLRGVIEALRKDGRLGGKVHHDTVRTRIAILRAVAEELSPRQTGLTIRPTAGTDDKNVVHYVIEDPDVEAMT
jgi:hypothetical protein